MNKKTIALAARQNGMEFVLLYKNEFCFRDNLDKAETEMMRYYPFRPRIVDIDVYIDEHF